MFGNLDDPIDSKAIMEAVKNKFNKDINKQEDI